MEKEYLIRLGRHIRQLRETAGMSQEELAKKAGFAGRAAVSAIEKGKNNISIDRLPDLARALNTTPGALMDVLSGIEKAVILSEEQEFISKYRHLDATDKVKVESYTDGLLSQEKYTAPRSSEGVS